MSHADLAIIIQPYQNLLTAHGTLADMRQRLELLRGVDPDTLYVLVPLAIGCEGGLSERQARFLVRYLLGVAVRKDSAVCQFYERLCLDDDVRPWIDARMAEGIADG